MAKCPVCGSRKGKRKCPMADAPVCTLCCGETRKKETCADCPFFKEAGVKRKYNEVPSFSTQRMEADSGLQDYANAIEGAICAFDHEKEERINDDVPIRVVERLLDKYHFRDEAIVFDHNLVEEAFHCVEEVIRKELSEVPDDTLVKVLSVIRFVAARRSKGGREYLEVIKRYVGIRLGPGARIMQI